MSSVYSIGEATFRNPLVRDVAQCVICDKPITDGEFRILGHRISQWWNRPTKIYRERCHEACHSGTPAPTKEQQ